MFMEKFIEPELTFMELQYEEIITQSGAGLGEEGWEVVNPPVNPTTKETKDNKQWPNF